MRKHLKHRDLSDTMKAIKGNVIEVKGKITADRGTRPTMSNELWVKPSHDIDIMCILTNAPALCRVPSFPNTTRFEGELTKSM